MPPSHAAAHRLCITVYHDKVAKGCHGWIGEKTTYVPSSTTFTLSQATQNLRAVLIASCSLSSLRSNLQQPLLASIPSEASLAKAFYLA